MRLFQLYSVMLILMIITGLRQVSAQQDNPSAMVLPQHENCRDLALRDAKAVNRWWWGWLGGYSAATVAQGIAGISSGERSFRQDMFLSAATTLVGAAGQLVSAVRPVTIRKGWVRPKDSVSQGYSEEECFRYLVTSAAREKKGKGWQMHLASGAVNLTSGLVTWVGFRRTWKDGLINFAINSAVTELQIWSQPLQAKRILEGKRKAGKPAFRALKGSNREYSLTVRTSGNGLCLAVSF